MSDVSYTPRVGDVVIGKIEKVNLGGWTVNINSLYLAQLEASEIMPGLRCNLNVGDLIVAKVSQYDGSRCLKVTVGEPGLGRITRGQTVQIKHTKLLFMSGKQDLITRALSTIVRETGCYVILGLNGVVLIVGEKSLSEEKKSIHEELAKKAIRMIGEKPYTNDLPDQIAQMLNEEKLKSNNTHAR